MHFSTWIIYAAVAMAAILCPGPAVFLAISNSVAFGWRRVSFSSLGNMLGLLVVSSLAMAGLGALMKTSAAVFTAVKLVGAGYLIYLGLRQWRSRGSLFTKGPEADCGGNRIGGRSRICSARAGSGSWCGAFRCAACCAFNGTTSSARPGR